jgi:hypothetical protein
MTTSDEMDDAKFPGYVAERLSSVPGVMAVALGVPTYIVVAELAVNVVLHGGLPSPGGSLTANPPSLVAAVDAASDLIGEAAG